jgi:hypothetical protein
MIEPQTKEIDGLTFTVAPFGGAEAIKLHVYLVKLLGVPAAKALGGIGNMSGKKALKKVDFDLNAIGEGIERLLSELDETTYMALLKRLLARTQVSFGGADDEVKTLPFGAEQFEKTVNKVFAGHVFSLYPLILFVLEVNYPDFFTITSGFGNRIQTILTLRAGEGNAESGLRNSATSGV